MDLEVFLAAVRTALWNGGREELYDVLMTYEETARNHFEPGSNRDIDDFLDILHELEELCSRDIRRNDRYAIENIERLIDEAADYARSLSRY